MFPNCSEQKRGLRTFLLWIPSLRLSVGTAVTVPLSLSLVSSRGGRRGRGGGLLILYRVFHKDYHITISVLNLILWELASWHFLNVYRDFNLRLRPSKTVKLHARPQLECYSRISTLMTDLGVDPGTYLSDCKFNHESYGILTKRRLLIIQHKLRYPNYYRVHALNQAMKSNIITVHLK